MTAFLHLDERGTPEKDALLVKHSHSSFHISEYKLAIGPKALRLLLIVTAPVLFPLILSLQLYARVLLPVPLVHPVVLWPRSL